jgi:hypothetical protein
LIGAVANAAGDTIDTQGRTPVRPSFLRRSRCAKTVSVRVGISRAARTRTGGDVRSITFVRGSVQGIESALRPAQILRNSSRERAGDEIFLNLSERAAGRVRVPCARRAP